MSTRPSVVVAGAGYSGLTAGLHLRMLGFENVVILDARDRPGGRACTNHAVVPGSWVDEGPEFVGDNHTSLLALARRFGIELIRMRDYEGPYSRTIPNAEYSLARCSLFTREIGECAVRLVEAARVVDLHEPWNTRDGERLDCTSLGEWLAAQQLSPDCRRAFEVQVVANHGVALDRLSLLGFLVLVKAHGLERYLDQTELYRLRGGAQSLALKMAEALSAHLQLASAIVSVKEEGNGVVVRTRRGKEYRADYLILTIPPSVWESIEFTPALNGRLRMQMGMNAKIFAVLEGQLQFEAGLSPHALKGTGVLQLLWNTTEAQEGSQSVLTGFCGGQNALKLCALHKDDLRMFVLSELRDIIPDLNQRLVSVYVKPWPTDPYTRAGYSAPAPGQITRVWPKYHRGLGPIIFAGEYFARQWAFMNGAICSGANAVGRLVEQLDGKACPLSTLHC